MWTDSKATGKILVKTTQPTQYKGLLNSYLWITKNIDEVSHLNAMKRKIN